MEKVIEKFEMGLDAQKRFAQIYEDRHMHKRIGSKMVKLDPIIIQKSRKEIRAGKTKPPLKIRNKSNDLARIFLRMGVTKRGTPLDYGFRSQETLFFYGF